MLPTSGFDYLTQKQFEDPRISARNAERRAMIDEALRTRPQPVRLLVRVLNPIHTFRRGGFARA